MTLQISIPPFLPKNSKKPNTIYVGILKSLIEIAEEADLKHTIEIALKRNNLPEAANYPVFICPSEALF